MWSAFARRAARPLLGRARTRLARSSWRTHSPRCESSSVALNGLKNRTGATLTLASFGLAGLAAASYLLAEIAYAEEEKKEQQKLTDTQKQMVAIMKTALEKGKLQDAAVLLWDLLASEKEKQPLDIQALLTKGRIDEAITMLTKQLNESPHNAELNKNMAMALILKEKFDEALFWLDESLWVEPKGDPTIFFHRGNILDRRGRHQEALTCYEKAIILNPKFRDAIEAWGETLQKLAIPPEHKLVDYCRGSAYYELGMYDESLQSFNAAIQKDPSFKEAHYNVAVVSHMAENANKLLSGRTTAIKGEQLANITTHYEYAAMSEATYTDSRAAVPKGWNVLMTSTDVGDRDGNFSRDGFYATAYINHDKREIVVAHKGSHSKEDIITDINLFINQVDRQFLCAKKFAEKVIQKAKSDPALRSYGVTFTGHSLGAAEAEYVAYKFKTKAVTFESPGSLEIIQTLERNPLVDPRSVDCISYLSRPNLINTAKTHVGSVLRMYPPLPSHLFKAENALLVEKVIEGVKKLLQFLFIPGIEGLETKITNNVLQLAAETEVLLLETAHWHSMPRIAQAFRHQYDTGIPVQCRDVVKWPNTKSYYLFYRVSRDTISGEPVRGELGELNQEVLDYAQYLVAPRDLFAVPLSQFHASERRFLLDFLNHRYKVEPYLKDEEKKILANYRIEHNRVVLTTLVSRDEWAAYVKRTFKRLTDEEPAMFGYWY